MQELPQTGGTCGKVFIIIYFFNKEVDIFIIIISILDLLWSDPEAQVDSWAISPRGGGFLFGHLPTNAVSRYMRVEEHTIFKRNLI